MRLTMFSLIVSDGSFSICPYKNLKLLGFFEYLFGFGEFSILLLVCPAIFFFHSYQSCFLGDFFPDGMAQDFLWTCFPWVTALGHFPGFTSFPEEPHIPTASADCPAPCCHVGLAQSSTFPPFSHLERSSQNLQNGYVLGGKRICQSSPVQLFFKETWRHKLSVTALICMKRYCQAHWAWHITDMAYWHITDILQMTMWGKLEWKSRSSAAWREGGAHT